MQRVNIVVGRFQPFTAGHYTCVETAKKLKGLPTVICMINTTEDKVDRRHPFTTDMLLYSYNQLFSSDPYIEKVVPVKNANIVAIGEELKRYGYEIASWTCGTDRYDSYEQMATKYHDAAGLTDDFEVIEVKRNLEKDISATKCRNCLLDGDKMGFFSMMPSSVQPRSEDPKDPANVMFDNLKAQIEKVYGVSERFFRRRSFVKPTLEERVMRLERLLRVR